MNLMTANVMQGLIGAGTYMGSANSAFSLYSQAKAAGDEGMMRNAMGFMAGTMGAAMSLGDAVQAALEAAQAEETAQAEAELEAALKQSQSGGGDSVEISVQAKIALAADGKTARIDAAQAEIASDIASTARTGARIYRPDGAVVAAAPSPTVSVTV